MKRKTGNKPQEMGEVRRIWTLWTIWTAWTYLRVFRFLARRGRRVYGFGVARTPRLRFWRGADAASTGSARPGRCVYVDATSPSRGISGADAAST
ncbi:MAG TPA: hypothetical protein PLI09_10650 [Candidatus Hydrogenedentes bacterium]|nr:hypothetical protein [Candidatus Hydrogenedentota bacterium]